MALLIITPSRRPQLLAPPVLAGVAAPTGGASQNRDIGSRCKAAAGGALGEERAGRAGGRSSYRYLDGPLPWRPLTPSGAVSGLRALAEYPVPDMQ